MINPINFMPILLATAAGNNGDAGNACQTAENKPDNPPKTRLYPADSFKSCPTSNYVVLDPTTSAKPLYKGQEPFWVFLNQQGIGFYDIDHLTWEQAASYIYNVPLDDPKIDGAAKALKAANGDVETPYNTLNTAETIDYNLFYVTTGIPVLSRAIPFTLGHLPKLTLIAPPLEAPKDQAPVVKPPVVTAPAPKPVTTPKPGPKPVIKKPVAVPPKTPEAHEPPKPPKKDLNFEEFTPPKP